MKSRKDINLKRGRRITRIQAVIRGTASQPRLSVFRSNRYIYAQILNDELGKTLIKASASELTPADRKKTKTEQAELVGKLIGEKSIKEKIEKVVFDRRSYKYHGRVKALAEGARKAGLKF
jgi:large subunit ribosomal protein L18